MLAVLPPHVSATYALEVVVKHRTCAELFAPGKRRNGTLKGTMASSSAELDAITIGLSSGGN